jgi:hypothetical protein
MGLRNGGIVRENCQPVLQNGLRVILLLAFDGLQRVEIESHAPGDVNVRDSGRQE